MLPDEREALGTSKIEKGSPDERAVMLSEGEVVAASGWGEGVPPVVPEEQITRSDRGEIFSSEGAANVSKGEQLARSDKGL